MRPCAARNGSALAIAQPVVKFEEGGHARLDRAQGPAQLAAHRGRNGPLGAIDHGAGGVPLSRCTNATATSRRAWRFRARSDTGIVPSPAATPSFTPLTPNPTTRDLLTLAPTDSTDTASETAVLVRRIAAVLRSYDAPAEEIRRYLVASRLGGAVALAFYAEVSTVDGVEIVEIDGTGAHAEDDEWLWDVAVDALAGVTAEEGRGAFFNFMVSATPTGEVAALIDFTGPPWVLEDLIVEDTGAGTDLDYELEEFPRDDEHVPEWFRAVLATGEPPAWPGHSLWCDEPANSGLPEVLWPTLVTRETLERALYDLAHPHPPVHTPDPERARDAADELASSIVKVILEQRPRANRAVFTSWHLSNMSQSRLVFYEDDQEVPATEWPLLEQVGHAGVADFAPFTIRDATARADTGAFFTLVMEVELGESGHASYHLDLDYDTAPPLEMPAGILASELRLYPRSPENRPAWFTRAMHDLGDQDPYAWLGA